MEGIKATLREIGESPRSWELWSTRVLTIAIVLVFAAAFQLGKMIADNQRLIENGRAERTQFQQEETGRQCTLLEAAGVTPTRLRELKC